MYVARPRARTLARVLARSGQRLHSALWVHVYVARTTVTTKPPWTIERIRVDVHGGFDATLIYTVLLYKGARLLLKCLFAPGCNRATLVPNILYTAPVNTTRHTSPISIGGVWRTFCGVQYTAYLCFYGTKTFIAFLLHWHVPCCTKLLKTRRVGRAYLERFAAQKITPATTFGIAPVTSSAAWSGLPSCLASKAHRLDIIVGRNVTCLTWHTSCPLVVNTANMFLVSIDCFRVARRQNIGP